MFFPKIFSQMEQAKELKKSFEIKSKEFENLSQKYQPLNICHVLRLEAINSDEESEIIAEKFLNKEIDIEKFLLEYVEKRKVMIYSLSREREMQ